MSSTVTALELDIWHPDCWTIEVTDRSDVELYSHNVTKITDDTVLGYFTLVSDGDNMADVLDDIRNSEPVQMVREIESDPEESLYPGKGTQKFVAEYSIDNNLTKSIRQQRVIINRPVHISDGTEKWIIIAPDSREEIQEKISNIQNLEEADVTVKKVKSSSGIMNDKIGGVLTHRQQEVIDLARKEGYYTWPRETDLQSIADQLGISENTALEHLRKAEAKILGTEESQRSLSH